MAPSLHSPLTCVGLDIGYGALKLVHSELIPGAQPPAPKEKLLPVGAAPEHLVAQDELSDLRRSNDGGHSVLVNGQPWIAGVPPFRIQGGQDRQLHENYATTDEYWALFLAALAQVGAREIDVLVTGLPTSQALDRNFSGQLRERLAAKHAVSSELVVSVRRAVVIAQPLGAHQDLVSRQPDVATRDDQYLLVVDPGFFSCDWIVMQGKRPLPEHSFSSTHAWSRVLELTQAKLRPLNPHFKVSINRLDEAVRKNQARHFHLGAVGEVDLTPLIEAAAAEVAKASMPAMLRRLRSLSDTPATVLICGGAAEAFRPTIAEAFPGAQVHVSPRPQFANARGFLRYAAMMAMADVSTRKVA